jgi:hypothetical protein
MWRILCCALILALAVFGLPAAQPAAAAATTYTVTNTNDSGPGSLRYAINQANGNAGADTINFAIPGTDPNCTLAGVCTIHLNSMLLIWNDNLGVTIDGYTQPGAATATVSTAAVLKIVLDGAALPSDVNNPSVIGINSAKNVVRGLVIHSSPTNGIAITKVSGIGQPYYNTISGNYIGTDVTGTGNLGNVLDGVYLGDGSFSNVIGGLEPAARNILAANGWVGVGVWGTQTVQNYVVGNYIGVDASGAIALGNTVNGVRVYGGANGNIIGWGTPAGRNVISGNLIANVRIAGAGTDENGVSGNYIGTNAAGDAALGGTYGVYILDGATHNGVGSTTDGGGNLISGNSGYGVLIDGNATLVNLIYGNWIGLNAAGTAALPNGVHGIKITNAAGNLIGGTTAGSRNVISGNTNNGIELGGSNASENRVRNNSIGTNPAGNASIPNGWQGVMIYNGAHDNTIGGENSGEGNLISGNTRNGVLISGAGTVNNRVSGNLIGLSAGGLSALGNQEYGVQINIGAQANFIGGDDLISSGVPGTFSRNVISTNLDGQVSITESGTTLNLVSGNYIGTDITGLVGLAGFSESVSGVIVQNSASYNVIGTCNEFEGNVISANPGHGVSINSSGANYNTLGCNYIGVGADGETPLSNDGYGVSIGANASHNVVGPYNTVAYNTFDGVYVMGDDSDDNKITQCSIYSNTNQGIQLNINGNNNMPAPLITGAALGGAPGDDDTVSGTACASCVVEVFGSPTADGEGQEYYGVVTATAGGTFSLTAVTLKYPYLTATAYRSGDGTSEFSAVYVAPFTFIYLPVINR